MDKSVEKEDLSGTLLQMYLENPHVGNKYEAAGNVERRTAWNPCVG
jgi:hypothetical protein